VGIKETRALSAGKPKEDKLSAFDSARKIYPGTKRGNTTEFNNFVKKHKDWKAVLPLIEPAIRKQITWRANANGAFRPIWKIFSTWINNRCWEDEMGLSESGDDKVCVICRDTGFKYQNDQRGKKVWLCEKCHGAYKKNHPKDGWAVWPLVELERIIEQGKADRRLK